MSAWLSATEAQSVLGMTTKNIMLRLQAEESGAIKPEPGRVALLACFTKIGTERYRAPEALLHLWANTAGSAAAFEAYCLIAAEKAHAA